MFGVPLVDLVTREGRAIPYIVQKIVEHMEEEGEEGGRVRREGGREGEEGGREGDCMKTVHVQDINVGTRTHFSFDLTVVVSTSLARSTQMICKVG